jgi:hypothetical protein
MSKTPPIPSILNRLPSNQAFNSSSAIKSTMNATQLSPSGRGKWCAMHVRIAWEIYSQQQRMAGQLAPNVPSSNSLNLFQKSPKLLTSAAPHPTGSPSSKQMASSLRSSISPSMMNNSTVNPHPRSSVPYLTPSHPSMNPSALPPNLSASASLEMIKGMSSMFGLLPGNTNTVNPTLSIGRPSTGLSSFSSSLLSAAVGIGPSGSSNSPSTSKADGGLGAGYNVFMYPPSTHTKQPPLHPPVSVPNSLSSSAPMSNMQMQRKSPMQPNPLNAPNDVWGRNVPNAALASYSAAISKYAEAEAKMQRLKEPCHSPIRNNSKGSIESQMTVQHSMHLNPSHPMSGPMNTMNVPGHRRRENSSERAFKRELSISPSSQAHASKMLKPNSSDVVAVKTSNAANKSAFIRNKEDHVRPKEMKMPNLYPPNFQSFPPVPGNNMMSNQLVLERTRMLGMLGAYPPSTMANGTSNSAYQALAMNSGLAPPGLGQLSNGLPQTNPHLSSANLMNANSMGGSISNGLPPTLPHSLHSAMSSHGMPGVISNSGLPPNALPVSFSNPMPNVGFPNGPPVSVSSSGSNCTISDFQAAAAAADAFKYWSSMPAFYAAAAAAANGNSSAGLPTGVPGQNSAAAVAAAMANSAANTSNMSNQAPLSALHAGQPIPPNLTPVMGGNPFKNLHDFTRNGFLEREHLLNRYNILNSSGGGAPLTEKLAKDSAEKRVFVNS